MRKLKTGWLSPTGEFFEAGVYEHLEVSHGLASKTNIPDYDFQKGRRISDDEKLLRSGWVYVGSSFLSHEWRVAWGRRMTPEQRLFLRPYFEDKDLPMNAVAKDRWELEA